MDLIYAWGANSHGQLGLGYESELCAVPNLLADLPSTDFAGNLTAISGGGGHCMFLTKDGTVYSCGWNNRGQLGIGVNTESISKFVQIPNKHFDGGRIRAVRTGWDCSAAISIKGELFVWGSNAFQQLGWNKEKFLSSSLPRRFTLPDDELCIDLQFGLRSTVFLTSRHLLVIGSPKLLQSLHTKWSKFTDIVHYNGVEYMRLSQVVDHLSVGQNHISFVTQAAQNIVQSCGDARYGLGSDVSLWSEESRIRKLVSGWTHCGALNDNGEVQLWGRNNYAQLGQDPTITGKIVELPRKLCIPGDTNDRIIDLALGAEHGLVVTRSLAVWTWGWNEHGNCGNGSDVNVVEPIQVQLPGKCKLAAAGAGFCYAVVSKSEEMNYTQSYNKL